MTSREFLDRAAGKLLTVADRFTHTRYRRQARMRMQAKPRPGRILILCYGNICRSPYAEAYLQQNLRSKGIAGIEVSSAGLYGQDRGANEQATAIGGSRGIDLTRHRSRLVDANTAEGAELILVMTRSQRRRVIGDFRVPRDCVELLGDFDDQDPPYREITDPYGHPDGVFNQVFDQIERSVAGLCACWP